MKDKPKVSVITTVYNCRDYIESSIESILKQKYEDFEFIIVNDGSTDDTWEKVTSFQDPRIILINNKENKKIPFRRNQAIEQARGEYIAIHDGDDESLPIRLQQQVDYLDFHKKIFCVGGHAVKINVNGEETGFMTYPPTRHVEIVRLYTRFVNPIIDPTCMFRREDFISLGCYSLDPAIYTVQDLDLWGRAILEGKRLSNERTPVIRYRINPQGVTRKCKKEMISAHSFVTRNFLIKYVEQKREKLIRGPQYVSKEKTTQTE